MRKIFIQFTQESIDTLNKMGFVFRNEDEVRIAYNDITLANLSKFRKACYLLNEEECDFNEISARIKKQDFTLLVLNGQLEVSDEQEYALNQPFYKDFLKTLYAEQTEIWV